MAHVWLGFHKLICPLLGCGQVADMSEIPAAPEAPLAAADGPGPSWYDQAEDFISSDVEDDEPAVLDNAAEAWAWFQQQV